MLATRNIVYLILFHVVWSVYAVVFFTLILFLSFSTDPDLIFWSNVELPWSFTVFVVVFQALVYIVLLQQIFREIQSLCICPKLRTGHFA